MNATVLLTGGLGFIGSHTTIELLNCGYRVIIIDNLSNAKQNVLDKLNKIVDTTHLTFIEGDILLKTDLDKIDDNIDMIIHFAAYKSVSQSLKNPLDYYRNNISGLLNILEFAKHKKINRFIFSSSATVYGSQLSPLKETTPIGIGITNPYGRTKYMAELILKDYCISNSQFNVITLRYFNPVGAHPSGLIGEDPNDIPNNLMPYLLKVVTKNNLDSNYDSNYDNLNIFGIDYQTKDGTSERDFIHVCDLAKAHVASCNKIDTLNTNFEVFNIGTGKPTSVLKLVNTFIKTNNVKLPYNIMNRREGDIDIVFCNPEKATKLLNWSSQKTIKDICMDSYRFIKTQYSV